MTVFQRYIERVWIWFLAFGFVSEVLLTVQHSLNHELTAFVSLTLTVFLWIALIESHLDKKSQLLWEVMNPSPNEKA